MPRWLFLLSPSNVCFIREAGSLLVMKAGSKLCFRPCSKIQLTLSISWRSSGLAGENLLLATIRHSTLMIGMLKSLPSRMSPDPVKLLSIISSTS